MRRRLSDETNVELLVVDGKDAANHGGILKGARTTADAGEAHSSPMAVQVH